MPKTTKHNVPTPKYILPEILTIGEMIERAFGDPKKNIVYFNLIRIILVILARQLKLLQRTVNIELPDDYIFYASGSSLSISEVKIRAKVKKRQHLRRALSSPIHTKEKPSRVKTGGASLSGAQKESPAKARLGDRIVSRPVMEHELGIKSFSKTAHEIISTSRVKDQSQTSGRMGDKLSTASAMGSQKLQTRDKGASARKVLSMAERVSPKDKSLLMKSKHKSHSGRATSDRPDQATADISLSHKTTRGKKRYLHRQAEIDTDTDMEDQYEKLLVVETVPIEEAKARAGKLQGETRGKTPRLSIVTQEEFLQLTADVLKLQTKLDPTGQIDLPENLHFLQALRKGATFTDALTALQLSARLEASERALERMTTLVTDLAKQYPNIDLAALFEQAEPEGKVLFFAGASVPSSHTPLHLSTKSATFNPQSEIRKISQDSMLPQRSILDSGSLHTFSSQSQNVLHTPVEEEENKDWITEDDLQYHLLIIHIY